MASSEVVRVRLYDNLQESERLEDNRLADEIGLNFSPSQMRDYRRELRRMATADKTKVKKNGTA